MDPVMMGDSVSEWEAVASVLRSEFHSDLNTYFYASVLFFQNPVNVVYYTVYTNSVVVILLAFDFAF